MFKMLHRYQGAKLSAAERFLQFIENIAILALSKKIFRATSKNRIAKSIHPYLLIRCKECLKPIAYFGFLTFETLNYLDKEGSF